MRLWVYIWVGLAVCGGVLSDAVAQQNQGRVFRPYNKKVSFSSPEDQGMITNSPDQAIRKEQATTKRADALVGKEQITETPAFRSFMAPESKGSSGMSAAMWAEEAAETESRKPAKDTSFWDNTLSSLSGADAHKGTPSSEEAWQWLAEQSGNGQTQSAKEEDSDDEIFLLNRRIEQAGREGETSEAGGLLRFQPVSAGGIQMTESSSATSITSGQLSADDTEETIRVRLENERGSTDAIGAAEVLADPSVGMWKPWKTVEALPEDAGMPQTRAFLAELAGENDISVWGRAQWLPDEITMGGLNLDTALGGENPPDSSTEFVRAGYSTVEEFDPGTSFFPSSSSTGSDSSLWKAGDWQDSAFVPESKAGWSGGAGSSPTVTDSGLLSTPRVETDTSTERIIREVPRGNAYQPTWR